MLKKIETRNSLKTLKVRNRKLVLQFMRNSAAVSINEISRATSLSKMTVHKIIDYYLDEEMISHAGKGVSTEEGGKKPNLFIFNADCRYIFAVRLTETCLHTAVVNLKGEMIVKSRLVALANAGFDRIVELIGNAFSDQLAEKGLSRENCLAVVIGCDGFVDSDNGEIYQYTGGEQSFPLRERLRTFLPEGTPVHVDSWWRHLAYGEVHFNAGRRSFFLLGNSGGHISGGMVFDRQICRDATGLVGEAGHMIVASCGDEKGDADCAGRLESLTAPGKIVQRARQLAGAYPESVLFVGNEGGADIAFNRIGEAADAGDRLARLLFDEVAGHFAVAINNIVHICDPGEIVLFGDYARAGNYFQETLRTRLGRLLLPGIDRRTRVVASGLSDEHGVVGAAIHITDLLFSE